MESIEKNNQISYEAKTLLTEKDEKIVKESLETLLHKLSDIPNEKLPAIVAFLDTTARPMAYAVKPILKKIYRKAQINEPEIQFLTTYRNIDQDKTAAGYLFTETFFYEMAEGTLFEEALKKATDECLLMGDDEATLKSYSKQITDHYLTLMARINSLLESAKGSPILIFDDYISNMTSYRQIVGVSKALRVNPGQITFFSMYGMWSKEHLEKTAYPDVPIWIGSDAKGTKWSGFSYRSEPEKSKYLGVTKDSPNIAKRISSEEMDSEKMKELRQIFNNLGEEISQEIHK